MEELEQEELDKDLLGVATTTDELPEVPASELKDPAAKAKEKKKGTIQMNTGSIFYWSN